MLTDTPDQGRREECLSYIVVVFHISWLAEGSGSLFFYFLKKQFVCETTLCTGWLGTLWLLLASRDSELPACLPGEVENLDPLTGLRFLFSLLSLVFYLFLFKRETLLHIHTHTECCCCCREIRSLWLPGRCWILSGADPVWIPTRSNETAQSVLVSFHTPKYTLTHTKLMTDAFICSTQFDQKREIT